MHASKNKKTNAINQSGKTTQRNRGVNMKTDLKEFFSYKIKEANVSWIYANTRIIFKILILFYLSLDLNIS